MSRHHDRMRVQHGLITRRQAKAAGLDEERVKYLIRIGEWIPVARSVYRHAGMPRTRLQAICAATLAGRGVASHLTAVELHSLDGAIRRGPLEITTDHLKSKRKLSGVRTHRSTQWAARQQTAVHGIECTGIERTLMDAGGCVGVNQLERFAESAVRRRLTTFPAIARYLVLHGKQGRTGSANLRTLMLRRDPAAKLPLSDFSRVVTQLIEGTGLPSPQLECRIYDQTGSFIMQADLVWPEQRKIVELDGLAWHFGRNEVEQDRRKRARARAEGWRIMEVLWSMYRDDRRALQRLLVDFLTESRALCA